MQTIRHLLAQRHLALLVCAAALLLRLLVPAGYMIDRDHGRIGITLCSGIVPAAMPDMQGMQGMQGAMPDHGRDHGKTEMPCAFSGLSAQSLGAIDSIQLAALIVLIVGMMPASVLPPTPARPRRLRPPLRAPPA